MDCGPKNSSSLAPIYGTGNFTKLPSTEMTNWSGDLRQRRGYTAQNVQNKEDHISVAH